MADTVSNNMTKKEILARAKELEAQNKEYRDRMVSSGNAPVPVKGTYEVVRGSGDDKEKSTYKFKDGSLHVRDEDGFLIPTEVLIKWAGDKNYEPDDELIEKYEGLRRLGDHEGAKAFMDHLVKIDYGRLEEV